MCRGQDPEVGDTEATPEPQSPTSRIVMRREATGDKGRRSLQRSGCSFRRLLPRPAGPRRQHVSTQRGNPSPQDPGGDTPFTMAPQTGPLAASDGHGPWLEPLGADSTRQAGAQGQGQRERLAGPAAGQLSPARARDKGWQRVRAPSLRLRPPTPEQSATLGGREACARSRVARRMWCRRPSLSSRSGASVANVGAASRWGRPRWAKAQCANSTHDLGCGRRRQTTPQVCSAEF